MAGKLLIQVFRRAGIKPAKGKVGPRIHDLRHRADFPIMPTFRAAAMQEALAA
jgi:hypothetical protein